MKNEIVLICDDNQFVIKMLGFSLEAEGLTVETAVTTEEIYRKVESNKPSLIFLDLNIPEEGGASVVQNLRSREETRNIPIILFSAEENLPEIASGLKADGYLKKPFDSDDLKTIINNFIHHHHI